MAGMKQSISSFFTKSSSNDSVSPEIKGVKRKKNTAESSNKIISRKIQTTWFTKYKWLKHDSNKKILICTWCIEAGHINTFTSGKSSEFPKVDDFSKHEKTLDHKFATEAKYAVERKEMPKAASKACEKLKNSIISTMKNVYYICKENIALGKLESLQELLIQQGCSQLQLLKSDENFKYTHHECIDDFIYSLKTVIETELLQKVKTAKFYGLEIDESTDIGNCQNLMLYIRFVVEGKVFSSFLSLVQLEEGSTAEKIYNKILMILKEKDLPISNLIALSTDGASTMIGCKNGLVTLFKKDNPFIISEHCASHRLALASSHAANSDPYLVKYQTILNEIYKYYKYSPKNSNVLKNSQNALGSKLLKFKQVFHTRWLSFYSGVETVLESIDPLLAALQSDIELNNNNARALSIQKNVGKFQFIGITHFLLDALGPLHNTCLALQSAELTFSDAIENLQSCQSALNSMIKDNNLNIEECKNLKEFLDGLHEDYQNKSELIYKSHTISTSSKQLDTVYKTAVCFITNIINNIEQRYASDKIYLFEIFNPSKIPNNKDDLPNFGKKEIKELGDMFGHEAVNSEKESLPAIVNAKDLASEWQTWKQIMFKNKDLSMKDFWCLQFKRYSNGPGYKNILQLATIALTCPITTTNVERGFSKQNLIKTDIRNNLRVKTLSDIILIKSEGPALNEFNFDHAFECWSTYKNRRFSNV